MILRRWCNFKIISNLADCNLLTSQFHNCHFFHMHFWGSITCTLFLGVNCRCLNLSLLKLMQRNVNKICRDLINITSFSCSPWPHPKGSDDGDVNYSFNWRFTYRCYLLLVKSIISCIRNNWSMHFEADCDNWDLLTNYPLLLLLVYW